MISRHLTRWIAQRAAKALAATALALGVSATVFAPATAHAAPLNPRPGPSLTPDLVTSIRPGDPKQRLTEIGFTVAMTNQGSREAQGVRIVVTLPDGFTDIKLSPDIQHACTVSGNSVSCSTPGLAGGQTVNLYIRARTPAVIGSYAVTSTIDPDNFVRELKETNNTATGTLLVI